MGAIQVGDRLFDEGGNICHVVFATDIMLGRPCNEIVFEGGTRIVADDEHLWRVVLRTGVEALLQTRDLRVLCKRHLVLGIRPCQPINTQFRGGRRDEKPRRALLDRLVARYGGCDDRGAWVRGRELRLDSIRRLCGALGLVTQMSEGVVSWRIGPDAGLHQIASIRSIQTRPVRCIQVDSKSRLFLCSESYIPTHNTFLMAEEIRRAARLAVKYGVGIENEIWYGAPTFLQAKRVMWGRLKVAIPRSWLASRPNETLCVLRLHSGHIIRLVGLDACDNLRGSGLWFFGGDEWADCRPSAWLEVIRPMLSTTRGHALFIGTPKGFDHFRDCYLLGQPGGDPDYRSFLFTTEDGGNVPSEELVAARREMDSRTFRQEYCASFETYAGRVIYAFNRAENVVTKPFDIARPLHVGMDFNVNPMSATVWQEFGETVCQVDEIIMPTSNTDEMAAEIISRFGRDGFEPGRRTVDHITIYPDPAGSQRRSSSAGRTDIGILREKGFNVSALRSHPSVRDRINVMNRQFRSADGTIVATVDARCVKSIEAYERLVFREGTTEPDKTQGFDHLVDASGYYLYGRQKTNSGVLIGSLMER